MESTAAADIQDGNPGPGTTGTRVVPFAAALLVAMTAATAVVVRLGWKHLRSRQIAPADSPIRVE
jgi:hypothetical protein